MLDLQTIKSYVLHFETLEIKSSGNPISLPYSITRIFFFLLSLSNSIPRDPVNSLFKGSI